MVLAGATARATAGALAAWLLLAAPGAAALGPTTVEAAGQRTPAALAVQVEPAAVGDLAPGRSVTADGSTLVMQGDGNLVVYRAGAALWHTSTWGHPGARFAAQQDGNLVVYAVDGRPLWHSSTDGLGATDLRLGAQGLSLQHDGSRAAWQNGTWLAGTLAPGSALRPGEQLLSPGRGYRLTLQQDANLVLYAAGGGAVWQSRTRGSGADSLRMQTDGNLVLYAGDAPVWHTVTYGLPGARLDLQGDGNAVVHADGRAVWDSGGYTGRSARTVLPPFVSTVSPVTAEQLGSSYRAGCPVPPSSLRLLRLSHVTFEGTVATGELVVHQDVAARTSEVFRRLYDLRFPVQQVVPVTAYGSSDDASMAANNTSAFDCRPTTGGTAWSEHSYGRALDVNPVQNPYVSGSVVLPPAGRAYLDRSLVRPGMVGPDVVAAFEAGGYRWGGSWTSPKDYQHFSTSGR